MLQESIAAFKDFSASDAAGAAAKKKPAPKKAPKQDTAPAAPQPKKESPPPKKSPQPKPKQPSGREGAAMASLVRTASKVFQCCIEMRGIEVRCGRTQGELSCHVRHMCWHPLLQAKHSSRSAAWLCKACSALLMLIRHCGHSCRIQIQYDAQVDGWSRALTPGSWRQMLG